MTSQTDPLDRVQRLRPTDADLRAHFPIETRAEVLERVLDNRDLARVRHTAPGRSRRARLTPIAASAAVLAIGVGAVALIGAGDHSDDSTQGPALIQPGASVPSGTLSASSPVGPHQYAYRAVTNYDLARNGKEVATGESDRDWVSVTGADVSLRKGSQAGSCFVFKGPKHPDLEEPTEKFFASLPTAPDRLRAYLRSHVSGSSSRDEAVFVAVGDMLRTDDLLASPKLRAAMVNVLVRTGGITLHQHVRDYLGRSAVRLDFMDQQRRPGELNSLYFSPTTFELLEERTGSDGQSGTQTGPSQPYRNPVASSSTPVELAGAADVTVMTTDRVVDTLPELPAGCERD